MSVLGGPTDVTVVNLGRIVSDVNGGQLSVVGQSFVNEGVMEAKDGSILNISNSSYINNGTLRVSGGTLRLGQSITLNGHGHLGPDGMTILQGGEFIIDEPMTVPILYVSAGGVLTHSRGKSGLDLTVTGDVTVEAGGTISADAKGYAPQTGPGKGANDGDRGSGGGYGGTGGRSATLAVGGSPYGSLMIPVDLGSGGGRSSGGWGGGAIRMLVGGTLRVDGTFSADGGDWVDARDGGGSGGSVYLKAASILGTGLVSATGGDAYYVGDVRYGGGGGGGRIAFDCQDVSAFGGRFDVSGGFGNENGGDGTCYVYPLLHIMGQVPQGSTNRTIEAVDLTFDKAVVESTFSAVDILLVGPEGRIPVTQSPLNLGGNVWRVMFPPQTAEGVYTLSVRPDIMALTGHAMDQDFDGTEGEAVDDIYHGTFRIDLTRPHVTGHTPVGKSTLPIGQVDVTFSEAMDAATFEPGDVKLSGPGGPFDLLANQQTDPVSFRITFAPQTTDGVYHVRIGPDIRDVAGNVMDQDGDGLGGQTPGDIYDATFTIGIGPRVLSASPIGTFDLRAGNLDTVTVVFNEAIGTGAGAPPLADSVRIVGPGGPILPATITPLGGFSYAIGFAQQTRRGVYVVTMGPALVDLDGNRMDQDQDGIQGESDDDVVAFRFEAFDADVVLTSPTTIAADDTAFDGESLCVRGATVTIDGVHTFSSLHLLEGAVLTHSLGASMSLHITGEAVISASSAISASGRGAGTPAATPGGTLGLTVDGALQLDGTIAADGSNSANGGGAGGTIEIVAATLVGAGTVSVQGGAGNSGGAGGSIAVICGNTSGFMGTNVACGGPGSVWGGAGAILLKSSPLDAGRVTIDNRGHQGVAAPVPTGAYQQIQILGGAVALLPAGQALTASELVIAAGARLVDRGDIQAALVRLSSGGTLELDAAESLQSLMIEDGGVLTCSPGGAGLQLTVSGDLTVASGGRITTDGLGYQGGLGPGAGLSATATSPGLGGGGGYGGAGGANGLSGAGQRYGSLMQPTDAGSGGGGGYAGGSMATGGAGGGAIRLIVGGTLRVDGMLTAAGMTGQSAGQARGGGGSGGGAYITTTNLVGAGIIAANGAGGGAAGGGAGGRVAVYCADLTRFAGRIEARGGTGSESGEAGTVFCYRTGPLHVVSHAPDGPRNSVVDAIDIAFDLQVNGASFGTDDVVVVGPDALPIVPTRPLQQISDYVWRIPLPPQLRDGVYRITIGPRITATNGRTMDQNYDGRESDTVADAYRGTFVIDTVPPQVVGQVPAVQFDQPADHLDINFSEAMAAESLQPAEFALAGPSGPIPVQTVLLLAGRTGCRVFFAPQAAEGSYTITVGSGVHDLAGNSLAAAYVGTFDLALPDLTASGVTWPVGQTWDGSPVMLSAEVVNAGRGAALAPFRVRFLVDGVSIGDQLVESGLAAGASRVVQQVWLPHAGARRVTVVVDPEGAIVETSRDNNTVTVDLPPILAPDITVLGVSWTPQSITDGQPVTFTATVSNVGLGIVERAFHLRFELDGTTIGSAGIPAGLAAGSPTTASISWQVIPGQHAIRVVADDLAAVEESDETNNTLSVSLPVIADQTPPQITGLSPQDGSRVHGVVNLQAAASDSVAVARFRFEVSPDRATWTVLGEGGTSQASWDVSSLADGTYYVRVTAADVAGNAASIIQTCVVDNTPALPVALSADPAELSVVLHWTPSTAPDFAYYRISRSTTPGAGYAPINGAMTRELFTDRNVAPGTRYYYVLTVLDQVGNAGAYSNEAAATPAGDSTPPVIASLSPVDGYRSASAIYVGAQASDNVGVTGYTFEYSSNGTTWTLIRQGSSPNVLWDVRRLASGEYQVRVTVADANGNASQSSRRYQVDHAAPSAPGNLRVTPDQVALVVAWDPLVYSDFHHYQLSRSVAGGPFSVIVVSTTSTAYVDRDVQPATTYTYRAAAFDYLGNRSEDSAESSGQPLPDTTAPFVESLAPRDESAVSGVVAVSAQGTDNVQIVSFAFHVIPAADGVETPIGQDAAPVQIEAGRWRGQMEWDVSALPEGRYTIRAIARDYGGNTRYLDQTVVVNHAPPAAPLAPTIQSPTSGGALDLSWPAIADPAVAGYHIYRSDTSGTGYVLVATRQETSYHDAGLQNDRPYYYVVTAFTQAGVESARSPEASGTASAKTDLLISGLRLDPLNPVLQAQTTVLALVHNNGPADAAANVFFYEEGDSAILIGVAFVSVTAGNTAEASCSWRPRAGGLAGISAELRNVRPADIDASNDSASVQVVVNLPPVARTGGEKACDWGRPVDFDAGASTDEDGIVIAYQWDFGDGQTASHSVASHLYALPGTYTATLTVIDNRGAVARDACRIVVRDTRADLVVSHLAWSPVDPQELDPVTITATISNVGKGPALVGFFATFYIDGQYKGYRRVSDLISQGGFVQVAFAWTATKGLHTVEVAADDIQNNVNETDETNNRVQVNLTLQQIFFPDLTLGDVSCTVSGSILSSEQPLTCLATVRNAGTADAFDFWTSLYLDDHLVARRHINELVVGAEQPLVFNFQPQAGQHSLTVACDDPVSSVLESDERNNTASLQLPVINLAYPDLAIESTDVLPRETVLSDGSSFEIAANVANHGPVAVEQPFKISFYLDGQYIGWHQIDSLPAGGVQSVALQTPARAGPHVASIVVDEAGAVDEADESNNAATHQIPAITLLYPDLVVSDVRWGPRDVKYGQRMVFWCTVSNITAVSTLDTFLFALYVDDVEIARQQLPRIAGHSSQPFVLTWNAVVDPAQPHTIKAVVDAGNVITEQDETNNTQVVASADFRIGDNFVIFADAANATRLPAGILVYTTRQIAEFVATVTRSSTTVPATPADGVTSHITVTKAGGIIIGPNGDPIQDPGTVVLDQPMTFVAASATYRASLSLADSGSGSYSVTITASDGVSTVSKMLAITVLEECNIAVRTDRASYSRGQPVRITGSVARTSGQPLAGKTVQLSITGGWQGGDDFSWFAYLSGENVRTLTTRTDAAGNFDLTYQPLVGDAGHFTVNASVGAALQGTQASAAYSILAADLSPALLHATTSKNRTYLRVLTLKNICDDALTGVTITLSDDQPEDNVTASLAPGIPRTLQPGEAIPITFTADVPESAPDQASFRISLVTDQGVQRESQINLSLSPAVPAPKITPNEVKVGLNPGQTLTRTVQLANVGLGTMRGIRLVAPPILPWVMLTGLNADVLAPAENATFSIVVSAPADLPLGIYADKIQATDGTHTAEMVISVEVTSANRGTVSLVIANDVGQDLQGADVTLVGRESLAVVYGDGRTSTYRSVFSARSDARGAVSFEDIPVGEYDVTVAAAGHETAHLLLNAMPQSQGQVLAVTLTAVPLSYRWTVEPIVIEDRYDITLNLTYVVDIPKPVFVFLPPWICVTHEVDSPILDQAVIVNPSLLQLQDVTVSVVGAPGITLASGGRIGTMAAQSSVSLGYQIAPGNYAGLSSTGSHLLVTGTYARFDPITLERLEDGTVVGSIPLVNPAPTQQVTVQYQEDQIVIPMFEGDGPLDLPPLPRDLPPTNAMTTAVVKLQISQTATLEREAFDARLELTNGLGRNLVGLTVTPRVTDETGRDVTDRFYMVPPELTGISAVDGSSSLAAFSTMTGRWVLIPGDGLGGTSLDGRKYLAKAVLSWFVDGRLKEMQTNAVEITVHPQPRLRLHYYVPKNVLADEPFKLGVLVENEGDGIASNLRIDSGQPKIVENVAGVPINFQILSSSFGSVTDNVVRLAFGDIQPHSTANGYWIMTASLDGRFVEFTAQLTHRAYKGVDINPLIVGVSTEIVEHDYLFADTQDPDNSLTLVDRDGDGFPDYMINLRTGVREPVAVPENVSITRSPSPLDRTMVLQVPPAAGYVCVVLPEPLPGTDVRSITRHGPPGTPDTVLPASQFWKSGSNLYFVDRLGSVDASGVRHAEAASYTIDLRSALDVQQGDLVPVEFSVLYPGSGAQTDGLPGAADSKAYILHPPQGDSFLGTYELVQPIFGLSIRPTVGQKAVIRAIIRNNGVVPQGGTVDIVAIAPSGVQTLLGSWQVAEDRPSQDAQGHVSLQHVLELRPLHKQVIIATWIPAESGTYTIRIGLDNDSPSGELSQSVVVNALPLPEAGTTFTSDVLLPTTFDGSRSSDPDGYLRLLSWDFGDGLWGSGMVPTHVYSKSGTYVVRVVAKDDTGAMAEDLAQVTIHETRPDLIVNLIETSPPAPAEGQAVVVTAVVKNIGDNPTSKPFLVGLYIDGAFAGQQQVSQSLAPGASAEVPFAWQASVGNHTFTCVADDLSDQIKEADENNNARSYSFNSSQVNFPDLVPTALGLSIDPQQPVNWGTSIRINATVANNGTLDAGDFRVNFYVDDLYLGYAVVHGLSCQAGSNTAVVALDWAPAAGPHTFSVFVDGPLNHVVELDETNNRLEQQVPALAFVYGDLVVSQLSIWPPDGRVDAGEMAFALATVRNDSTIATPVTIPVRLTVNGEVMAESQIDGLQAGEEKAIELGWMPSAGVWNAAVMVDPANTIPESSKANNTQVITDFAISIIRPDLGVSDISPVSPLRVGQDATIAVRIVNTGVGYALHPFNVRLLVDGQIVAVRRISDPMRGGSYRYWFANWRVTSRNPTQCSIAAVVDANEEIEESNEANNALERAFAILPSYMLDLSSSKPVYLTGESAHLVLVVADSTDVARVLGPADGLSAVLRLFNAADTKVMETPLPYDDLAQAFIYAPATSTLPPGPYRAEAEVTGPLQIQSKSVSFSVAEDFTVTVACDKPAYGLTDTVGISGAVRRTDGAPMPGATVSVTVDHSGTIRCLSAVSGPDGSYAATFTPLGGEGGMYEVRAETAINRLGREASTSFTIEGLTIDPPDVLCVMLSLASLELVFTLTNVGAAQQDELAVGVEYLSGSGVVSAVADDAAMARHLEPGQSTTFRIVLISGDSIGVRDWNVVVSSRYGSQTASSAAVLSVVVVSGVPRYHVEPDQLSVGVRPGQSVDRLVTLSNVGHAQMSDISIVPPLLPWVRAVLPATKSLAPGQSLSILLRFAPPATVEPAVYTDVLILNSNAGELRIPLSIVVAPTEVADVAVIVVNDLGLTVTGATVALAFHDSDFSAGASSELVARCQHLAGTTGPDGRVLFERILGGRYAFDVTAPAHDPQFGTIEVLPGPGLGEARIALRSRPFEITFAPEVSTETLSLGQTQLGIVLKPSPEAKLLTDRPGAEYLMLRSGAALSDRLAYLDVRPNRKFPENETISLNNLTAADLEHVAISVTGDVGQYVTLPCSSIAKVPAHGSVVLAYSISAAKVPAGGDLNIDGYLQIDAQSIGVSLKFPIRLRVADAESTHNGSLYHYVPYSGPWPTGPVMYGQDFINRWLDQATPSQTVTGHSAGGIRLSQDITSEREAVSLSMYLVNAWPDSITIDTARLVIRDDTGADVTGDFEIVPLELPAGVLAAGQATNARWQIRPLPGKGLGGTDSNGRAFQVFAQIAYQVAGRPGRTEMGPQEIRVNPPPQFVLRYQVEAVPGRPEAVEVRIIVSNTGVGMGRRLQVELPNVGGTAGTSTFTVENPAPLIFENLAPGASDQKSWILAFASPPDISAIASSLTAIAPTYSGEQPAFTLGAPVKYTFVSTHTIADLVAKLDELLEAAKNKIRHELQTVAEAYTELQWLFEESDALMQNEFIAWMAYDSSAQMFIESAGLLNHMKEFADSLAKIMLGAQPGGVPAVNAIAGSLGFVTELFQAIAQALDARAAQNDIQRIFARVADLISNSSTTTADWFRLFSENTAYRRLKEYLVTDALGRWYGRTPTPAEMLFVLDNVIAMGGESIIGMESLFTELGDLVKSTEYLLGSVKTDAIFPIDILYNEIAGLTDSMKQLGYGIGQTPEIRASLRNWWYCVGDSSSVVSSHFIQPTFVGFNQQQEDCLRQAVLNWEASINSTEILEIKFVLNDTMSRAGHTTIMPYDLYDTHQNAPKRALVELKANVMWWDNSPSDFTKADETASTGKPDAVSVAMHEICHALGFGYVDAPWPNGFKSHRAVETPGRSLVWTDGEVTIDLDDINSVDHIQAKGPRLGLMYYNAGAIAWQNTRHVIDPDIVYALIRSYDCYSTVPYVLPGSPIFLENWQFGTVYDHWEDMSRLMVLQWQNFTWHWDMVTQATLAGNYANSIGAMVVSGGVLSPALMGIYSDAFDGMRKNESYTYQGILREIAKFIRSHQYEAAGIWRIFDDFKNHVQYLIDHGAVDPEVSVDVQSINIPSLRVPDGGVIGAGPAEIVLTNTCDLRLHVVPTITIMSGQTAIASFEGDEVILTPGESAASGAVVVLPRSILYGMTGYDAVIYLNAWDPITLSSRLFGPFCAHVSTGTDAELVRFSLQTSSQPLGGPVGTTTSFTRMLDLGPATRSLRILLLHGDDADLDLHLYDSAGHHVGFLVPGGADEVKIPGASYTGSDSPYQIITIAPVVAGSQYRLEVIVNHATPDSRFAVSVLEIPEYPALLETSTETITVATGQRTIDLTLSALEWGGGAGVSSMQAVLDILTDPAGHPLSLTNSHITLSANTLAAGGNTDITLHLLLTDTAADGTYTGTLHVTGTDMASGAPLEQTVSITIQVDLTAPSIPAISVSPSPADTMPLTVQGTADPNTSVEVFLDEHSLGKVRSDSEGVFSLEFVLVGLGEHVFKARALDGAGNVSAFCAPVTMTSTVDPFPPHTEAILSGEQDSSGSYLSEVTVALVAEDTGGSGISRVQYAVGGGPWLDYSSSFVISAAGLTKISFRSTDSSGNAELTRSIYVTVVPPPLPAPEPPGLDPASDTGVAGDRVTSDLRPIIIGIAVPLATVQVYDGQNNLGSTTAAADGTYAFQVPSNLTEGSHEIRVRQIDQTGNTSVLSPVGLRLLVMHPTSRVLVLRGHDGDDTFSLRMNSGGNTVSLYENAPPSGPPTFDVPLNDVDAIDIRGGGGSDTLSIEGGDFTLKRDAAADTGTLTILLTNASTIRFASTQHLSNLNIGPGCTAIVEGGNVLVTNGLVLAGDAVLDLCDNLLIVRAAPGSRESVLSAVSVLIASAHNSTAKPWQGAGITSTIAKVTPYTTLAAVINDKGDGIPFRTEILGQPVGANDVIVKYTWDGDANLDGVVNADDYFQIDSGYITQKGGYYNGDFNYDGVVNADDYFLIDSAYIGQSGPLAASKPQSAISADVAVQQNAKKAEPDGVLSELFSTAPVL
ncbi:MAG: PKD domain-containing protein [Planctomycetota bacterium]|nr:PKD domain-containing protein [Planctomycetota bacterium]